MAKRKTARRRRSSARKSPATRRRRRAYRRNPPIVKTITTGIKNGVGVVLGKAAARGIPAQVGLDVSGAVGMATQAAIGLAIGMFGQKFLPRGMGEFVVAGAFASAIETAVAEADIPLLAPALAAYPGQLRAYPAASLPGGRDLSGYAVTRDASGMGFYADQEY